MSRVEREEENSKEVCAAPYLPPASKGPLPSPFRLEFAPRLTVACCWISAQGAEGDDDDDDDDDDL